ncbi:peptidylprolyl isomerase [Chelativorans sp. ZYF759]|uniref:peptidyl-prolyl cis-trans isomerase n=1 Tax=Chelativorans sp. ZYF759 TaxID=2692213 RepID=UPI00145CE620|nr:peptidyl-prolyl cis-trans isomerase [Chelativorans sp. ZYF759]NMG38508.1 peptidylprolyl isomerase [Chelativorans sp. ZYF759]
MLTSLRNASGSLVVKLLLGLLVLSFAVWGISGQMLGGGSNNVVTVGETSVSPIDYRLAHDRQMMMMSQQFGTQLTREQARAFGVDQQVLSQVVAGALLDEQAREMRLGLSVDRLAALTAEDPAFRGPDGRFDRGQFEWVLRQVGMRSQDYLANRERVAKRQQIVEAVSDGLTLPDTFLRAMALHQGERRSVDMIILPPRLVDDVEAPTQAELEAWYEANQENYVAPEYRTVSYLRLDPDSLADPAAISDDEVEAYYQANIERFSAEEQRRIEQIVFGDADEAEAALARIRDGEDFAAVAQDLGRAPGDLLLGIYAEGQVPDAAIGAAAFELDEGEVSDVVEGMFGAILLRVTEITPAGAEPLADVEDEIRQEIALDRSSDMVMSVYDSYEDARAAGDTMQEAADSLQLNAVTIEAIDASGRTPDGSTLDIPEASALVEEAFATEEGVENPPINIGTLGFLYYEVDAIAPSRQMTLDEVREQAAADWTAAERASRLSELAADIRQRVDGGESLAEIAEELGLSVQNKYGLNRTTNDSDLGRDGVAAVFAVPQGATSAMSLPDGRGHVVFTVTNVSQPMAAGPDAIDENTRTRMSAGLSDDLLDQLVARLQGVYPVSVNQNALQQALSF